MQTGGLELEGTKAEMKERQRVRSEDATLLALKWKGTQAKEYNRRPPEKGKGKEIDSLLEIPERNAA